MPSLRFRVRERDGRVLRPASGYHHMPVALCNTGEVFTTAPNAPFGEPRQGWQAVRD
jgi:hypothetical protein